jgi:hypothetical protein
MTSAPTRLISLDLSGKGIGVVTNAREERSMSDSDHARADGDSLLHYIITRTVRRLILCAHARRGLYPFHLWGWLAQ